MLAYLSSEITEQSKITITKSSNGEDASLFGAFSLDTTLCIELKIPRQIGVCSARLRIKDDAENAPDREFALEYKTASLGCDFYTLCLDLSHLCAGKQSGLFYYDFVFERGLEKDILFSDTKNNLDISLSKKEGRKFRLLIFEPEFKTPSWFCGSVMYHIFVDRFARSSKTLPLRPDAEFNPDWENGIPQYAEQNGGFVKNNMFFGGNLFGIVEKLPYLCELGVNVIYLSPIFKAYSNHKYDTGDYMQVDEMFGSDEALSLLISEAKKLNIKIILDGVFNHTGDDSLYFNKYGKYPSLGAYQSKNSPYKDWFSFSDFPDKYDSWWGIPILPKLNLGNPDCRNFLAGENSVIEKYTKMGIGGWRLDVADELSDEFLDMLRECAKKNSSIGEKNEETIIIGEVWENAADKIAYGKRRRYFRGKQLDSVMNYPFKNAITEYILTRNASVLADTLTELYASYPKCVSDSLMNILGTHDTERILTVLGEENKYHLPNSALAFTRMSRENRDKAIARLILASTIQYTIYGIPSVYYGDEAGMEGYHDPFCRMPYPWGHEEESLVSHYKLLGKIRKTEKALKEGVFKVLEYNGAYIAYERLYNNERLICAVNVGDVPCPIRHSGLNLLNGAYFEEPNLPPLSAVILKSILQ